MTDGHIDDFYVKFTFTSKIRAYCGILCSLISVKSGLRLVKIIDVSPPLS